MRINLGCVARGILLLLTSSGFLLLSPSAAAATYYVSYATGADTNAGTKASPWQNAPGMALCASSCNSTSINAGDHIILRGGDIWPNGDFAWTPPNMGSSSAPGYLGVDQTWYSTTAGTNSVNCGSSFCRPILDAGNAIIEGGNVNNAGKNIVANFGNFTYVTVDSFEMRHFYYDTNTLTGACCNIIFSYDGATNTTFENFYIHGWSYNSAGACCAPAFNGGGQLDTNITITTTIVDGSDTVLTTCTGGNTTCGAIAAIFNSGATITYSYFNDVSDGCVGEFPLVHDNVFQNILEPFDNEAHPNGCESLTDGNSSGGATSSIGLVFYNNIVRHTANGVVNVWSAPAFSRTSYLFNNVVYDAPANVFDIANPLSNCCGSAVVVNNTIECGPDSDPTSTCTGTASDLILSGTAFENNHFITSTSDYLDCSATSGSCGTASNNVPQSKSTANGQGYSSSETYAFSPTASSNSTVGAGTNLTSICNISSVLAPLCSDTTYAVTENTSNTAYPVIVTNARTTNPRPATGAWDAGAYEFASTTPPTAPSALLATPH